MNTQTAMNTGTIDANQNTKGQTSPIRIYTGDKLVTFFLVPLERQSAHTELPGIACISSFLAVESDNSIWFIERMEWIKSSCPVAFVRPNSFERALAGFVMPLALFCNASIVPALIDSSHPFKSLSFSACKR